MTPLVTQISWTNHLLIMSGCKTDEEREFYIRLCIKENYSKRQLERQLDSGYYERYMLSKETLLPESVKKLGENPFLHSFMETVFEEMCRYYTLKHGIEGEYGCFLTSVGSWWGVENIADKDGNIRSQSADIDVVAISDIDKQAVIGECKFKNEKINKGIYETLIRRGKLITSKYKVSKYIFFSLSGYTDWFENLKNEDVLLLILDSLYEM